MARPTTFSISLNFEDDDYRLEAVVRPYYVHEMEAFGEMKDYQVMEAVTQSCDRISPDGIEEVSVSNLAYYECVALFDAYQSFLVSKGRKPTK